MGEIKVTCPKCGYQFWMDEYECKACPNCGFVVRGPKASSDCSDCFITTATVKAAGLPDDAYELETLRKFRDQYLKKRDWGVALVEEYYKIAPRIVSAIESDPAKDEIYKDLFVKIQNIVSNIEQGYYDEAVRLYKLMVEGLKKRYNIN